MSNLREVARRVALTLGALIVLKIGSLVPLPGLVSPSELWATNTIGRVSIFALDVSPLLSATILFEIWRTFARGVDPSAPATQRALHRVRVLALVLAAFQAYGVAVGIEEVPRLVADPGWGFRLTTVIVLVAATALIGWLADLVTRDGVGSGLLLFAATALVEPLISQLKTWWQFLQTGAVSGSVAVVIGATVAGAIALLVALDHSHRQGRAQPAVDVWAPLIVITIVLLAGLGLRTELLHEASAARSPLLITLMSAAIVAISLLRSAKSGADLRQAMTPALASGGIFCALSIAARMVADRNLPVPAPQDVMVIVLTALAVIQTLRSLLPTTTAPDH